MRVAFFLGLCLVMVGCTTAPESPETAPESPTASEPAPMPTVDPEETDSEPPSETADPVTQGPTTSSPSGTLRLVAVDVGQGAAIVIHFPDGVVLVDAANRGSTSTNKLLDYLDDAGVASIKALVISNPDADHAGGCNEILAAYPVAAVYHQGFPKETQTWEECLTAMNNEGAPVYTDLELNPGDYLPLSNVATARLLNIEDGGSEVNPGSIALRVDYG